MSVPDFEHFEHPGFMEKATGFALSFRDWFAAGMPWRHPEEVSELFENCLPCPFYNSERRAFVGWPKGTCERCGCHVSADPNAILNMVNKPNKACPIGKWLPIIERVDDPATPGDDHS